MKISKVRIVGPKSRHIKMRYTCSNTGRKIRISVGSNDEDDAQALKRSFEAHLLLGFDPQLPDSGGSAPKMTWTDFRELYRSRHLSILRPTTRVHGKQAAHRGTDLQAEDIGSKGGA